MFFQGIKFVPIWVQLLLFPPHFRNRTIKDEPIFQFAVGSAKIENTLMIFIMVVLSLPLNGFVFCF
jgi:hypothetical protein